MVKVIMIAFNLKIYNVHGRKPSQDKRVSCSSYLEVVSKTALLNRLPTSIIAR